MCTFSLHDAVDTGHVWVLHTCCFVFKVVFVFNESEQQSNFKIWCNFIYRFSSCGWGWHDDGSHSVASQSTQANKPTHHPSQQPQGAWTSQRSDVRKTKPFYNNQYHLLAVRVNYYNKIRAEMQQNTQTRGLPRKTKTCRFSKLQWRRCVTRWGLGPNLQNIF